MFEPPKKSPWGDIQHCEVMCPGVFSVDTAGHGGIMVKNEVATGLLSPAARKCGFKEKGFTCFEEDTQAHVVMRELLDKKLWNIPPRVTDKVEFEKGLNASIKEYNPEYWQAREKAQAKATKMSKETTPKQKKDDISI